MATAKFDVGAILPDPDADVLVFPRTGDQYQPTFDTASADQTVQIDDDGMVEVDGDEGQDFWLYQETSQDDNGLSIGQQIAVTIPGQQAVEDQAVIGGDDPMTKIEHDEAVRQMRDAAELEVHDPAAHEELKHADDPEPEPEPEPQATREADPEGPVEPEQVAEPDAKAKAKKDDDAKPRAAAKK